MELHKSRASARRSHKKVRTGCKTCKIRKIKCDESKPQCKNCIKYGATCDDYQDVSSSTSHSQPPTGTAERPPFSPLLPRPNGRLTNHRDQASTASLPRLNMTDLELMHQWTTSTCYTMTNDPIMQKFWQHSVVLIGLRCDFVMRGVLALTALHMAHLQPSREPDMIETFITHHDHATRKAMSLMQGLHGLGGPDPQGNVDTPATTTPDDPKDQQLVDHLFCFACLTIYTVLANSHNPEDALLVASPSATDDQPSAPSWISLFIGARHLSLESYKALRPDSLVFPLMLFARDHAQVMDGISQQHPYLDKLRDHVNRSCSSSSGPGEGGGNEPDHRKIYNHAIDELHKSFTIFYKTPGPHDILDIFLWVSRVIHDYIPLLRDPSQETLAIFSYFCMLPKRIPRQWWLNRWADSLKIRTYELLDAEHRAWVVEPSTLEGQCVATGR